MTKAMPASPGNPDIRTCDLRFPHRPLVYAAESRPIGMRDSEAAGSRGNIMRLGAPARFDAFESILVSSVKDGFDMDSLAWRGHITRPVAATILATRGVMERER